jgi:predicted thioredoxin/glutaredoxin
MAIADLHDIAEKLHRLNEERRNVVEDDSVRLTRKLAIDLVHELDWLSQRIDALQGKKSAQSEDE